MENRPGPSGEAGHQKRVQSVFEEALEVPPQEIEAWLDRKCGEDRRLREEVVRLLSLARESEAFLGSKQAARSLRVLESFEPGKRVGPYEIVGELGRGGMGVVYLARRADGQFDQQVALKLLKRGMDSDAVLAGFLRERQILAWLQHPHIARLHDGGVTEDGHPWFALEYVEGRPITEYCDAEGLGPRARLKLVIDACHAIQHAHRNLVIHRDLKPSNLLVTGSGELKLLDFGIAEILRKSGAEDPGSLAPARAMTPEYAAPEQILNLPATTATDIHALGILLYELLTGQRPHRFPSDSPEDLARGDADSIVAIPSRVASTPGGRRFLRGDLDRILLKAIHKDPERRYGTAEALAEDLERFLADQPVNARRPSPLYRLRKFGKRNRWGLLGAFVVTAAILGAAAFASLQNARVQREQTRSEAVKNFLVNLVESANPNSVGGPAVRDEAILTVALERATTELAGEPAMQAELYDVVGRAYIARGELARARDPLVRALEIRRELYGEVHPAVADAAYGMAAILRREKRYEEAERYYREALEIRSALDGRRSLEVSVLLNGLGANAYGAGDFERAELYYRESLDIKKNLLPENHEEIATGYHNLAVLLSRKGNQEEAEGLMTLAVQTYQHVFGNTHPITAMSYHAMGRILHETGRYEEAEDEFRRALAIRVPDLGPNHPFTRESQENLALTLYDASDLAGAEAEFRTLLTAIEQDPGRTSPEYVRSLCNLADVLAEHGRIDEAAVAYEEAASTQLDPGEPDLAARTLTGRGWVDLARGRLPEALANLERAVATYSGEPEGSRGAVRARLRLGECLSRMGREAEAEAAFREAYRISTEHLRHTREAAQVRERLRRRLLATGRGEEARGLE